MAAMVRTDSGNTTTYVITDQAGSTMTATVTVSGLTGNLVTFASSGGLHFDGLAMMQVLIQLLATNLLPPSSVPNL